MVVRRCLHCCVGVVAVLAGLVHLDPARRIPPLFLGDLRNHEQEYQDFVLQTQEKLRSKRVLSPVLVHEVTDHEWLQGGLILDVGVFLGSSTRVLAGLLGNRTTVHGFDTFSGFPEAKWYIDDFEYPSEFRHNESWVQGLIEEHGLQFVDGKPSTLGFNIEYHRGMTYDTLQPLLDAHPDKPVKFLHVDIDTYEGALHALETCRKRMVVGTTVVFDDFFVLSGEFKAFWQFQKKYPFEYTWTAWGHDIGFKNAVSLKSLILFLTGWNFGRTKTYQFFMGLRYSLSWTDYFVLLASYSNNAVGLRVTGIGKLYDP